MLITTIYGPMQKFMTKVLGRLLPSDQDHFQQLLSFTIDMEVWNRTLTSLHIEQKHTWI